MGRRPCAGLRAAGPKTLRLSECRCFQLACLLIPLRFCRAQQVLKKALAYDGLSRGLHEAARAIEKGQAKLCVLAEDCNQPDYKKVVFGIWQCLTAPLSCCAEG